MPYIKQLTLSLLLLFSINSLNAEEKKAEKPTDKVEEKKERPIDISADTSEYLEAEKKILFEGNVYVEDKVLKLSCEKLIVELDDKKEIVKIICDEDVHIRKVTKTEKVESNSDHAVYYVLQEKVVLTGDPILKNGKETLRSDVITFYRKNNHIKTGRMSFVSKAASSTTLKTNKRRPVQINADSAEYVDKKQKVIFRGNVEVNDEGVFLNCDQLTVYLNEKKELKKIVARKNVVIKKQVEQETWVSHSDRATYYLIQDKIALSGNPTLKTGQDTLKSDNITFFRNSKKIVTGRVNIHSKGARPDAKKPK